MASLIFLLRTPDIEARDLQTSSSRVPWREIVTYPPFLQLTIFTLLWVLAVGAIGVFSVSFLKTEIGYSESRILFLTTCYFSGALVSLPLVGRLLDRTGSKVVLQSALSVSLAYHLSLWLLAARLVAPSFPLLIVLNFFNGMAGANFGLAHVRLMMNTMPSMGRSHFFAFFTVISSLMLGASPIVWGLIIDAIGNLEHFTGPVLWNRFSIFFGMVTMLIAVVALYSTRLREAGAKAPQGSRNEAIFRARLRQLWRLWQR